MSATCKLEQTQTLVTHMSLVTLADSEPHTASPTPCQVPRVTDCSHNPSGS